MRVVGRLDWKMHFRNYLWQLASRRRARSEQVLMSPLAPDAAPMAPLMATFALARAPEQAYTRARPHPARLPSPASPRPPRRTRCARAPPTSARAGPMAGRALGVLGRRRGDVAGAGAGRAGGRRGGGFPGCADGQHPAVSQRPRRQLAQPRPPPPAPPRRVQPKKKELVSNRLTPS